MSAASAFLRSVLKDLQSCRSHERGIAGLVIVIALIALAGVVIAGYAADARLKEVARVKESNKKLGDIDRSIQAFLVAQEPSVAQPQPLLPCPDDPTNATALEPVGTAETAVANACPSAAGIIPFLTLGLSESAALDDYGRYYTYIVDPVDVRLTAANGARRNYTSFGLTVTNWINAGPSPPAGDNATLQALYAIVGHGKNGAGAFTPSGTQIAVASTAVESNNCAPLTANCVDPSAAIVRYGPASNASGDDYFDDTVYPNDVSSGVLYSNSEITSGAGQVSVVGNAITETGGNTNDFALVTNPEAYTVDLGNGNNTFGVQAGTETDVVFLSSGGSRFFTVRGLIGGRGNDILYAANLSETFGYGGAGNDWILAGTSTNERLYYSGGSGDDVIVLNDPGNLALAGGQWGGATQLQPETWDAILANDNYQVAPATGTPPTTTTNPLPTRTGSNSISNASIIDANPPAASDGRNALTSAFPANRPAASQTFRPVPTGVHGGSGNDTLLIRSDGAAMTFDFGAIHTAGPGKIRGIEQIDLRCAGAHNIVLTQAAVTAMSDTQQVEVFLDSSQGDTVDVTDFGGTAAETSGTFPGVGLPRVVITNSGTVMTPAGQPAGVPCTSGVP